MPKIIKTTDAYQQYSKPMVMYFVKTCTSWIWLSAMIN